MDLRDQLADFEAAARRLLPDTTPIRIGHYSNLGLILRELRHRAGLSQHRLAALANVTKSGLAAREQRSGMTVGALVDHVRPLGYEVALIRCRRPAALIPRKDTP